MLGKGRGFLLGVEPLGVLEHVPRIEIVLHGALLVWLLFQKRPQESEENIGYQLIGGLSGGAPLTPEAENPIADDGTTGYN